MRLAFVENDNTMYLASISALSAIGFILLPARVDESCSRSRDVIGHTTSLNDSARSYADEVDSFELDVKAIIHAYDIQGYAVAEAFNLHRERLRRLPLLHSPLYLEFFLYVFQKLFGRAFVRHFSRKFI